MFRSIYFGKIGKEETEKLLEIYGRDGSFLARDSESVRGAFCLCVRKDNFVHTYRIYKSAGKWAVKTPPTVKPEFFESLDQLIDCYRRVTPDNMVPLLYPLEKTALYDSNQQKDFTYMEIC
ncbi:SH21A protein, partial [Atractosteus spatula]|nr:SH21A protein [Atractosteus spatula]